MYYDTRTNTPRSPRRLEVKLSDGALLGAPPSGWTPELLALCGLVEIVVTPRPADTDTHTTDRTVALVADVPTVVWAARPWTVDELAVQQAQANEVTIRTQATTALSANRAFLADPNVTNAELLAQVRRLTDQNVRLIRLALGQLDGTD